MTQVPASTGGAVRLHASCVAVAGTVDAGLLILGPSGAGKSALALELMALGARLVSDDQTDITSTPRGLAASAPPGLPQLIEARGIGLLPARLLSGCTLRLAVDLGHIEAARLPEKREISILDQRLHLLYAVEQRSFPAALIHFLQHLTEPGQIA